MQTGENIQYNNFKTYLRLKRPYGQLQLDEISGYKGYYTSERRSTSNDPNATGSKFFDNAPTSVGEYFVLDIEGSAKVFYGDTTKSVNDANEENATIFEYNLRLGTSNSASELSFSLAIIKSIQKNGKNYIWDGLQD